MGMPVTDLTCENVESRDLEAQYLADRLPPDLAERYEAHYFSCDQCWRTLQSSAEARAALFLLGRSRPRRPWRAWGLASAATLVVAVGAGVLFRGAPSDAASTLRGSADSLALRASAVGGALTITWHAVPGAERYRVRLHRADGDVVLERESAETKFSIPVESLPATARTRARRVTDATELLYWQVQAFDRVREPLLRSPLTPASPAVPP